MAIPPLDINTGDIRLGGSDATARSNAYLSPVNVSGFVKNQNWGLYIILGLAITAGLVISKRGK